MDKKYFKNKKVIVTGNTGFKGCWITEMLLSLGADVTGIALPPELNPNMYDMLGHKDRLDQEYIDVRDYDRLFKVFNREKPDIVFHLAAQPIVLDSYNDPRYTFDVNVMGTVNVCECVRQTESVRSFINVTTDKVYRNNEWEYAYRENDVLDGYDPYSNSKSCSELVTASYIRSFFQDRDLAVSTCRAGNVIGGGDFSSHRIIPDCYRGVVSGDGILVRNPNSVRPYQHVLEAVAFYLLVAQKQAEDKTLAGAYNVGPEVSDCVSTSCLCDLFCKSWGDGAQWKSTEKNGPHEANLLRLDTSKAKTVLGWMPNWNIERTIAETVKWYKGLAAGDDIVKLTQQQIADYLE